MPNCNEIWKPIEGYEGIYSVSNYGRVKRLQRTMYNSGTKGGIYTIREKILTPRVNTKRHGYCEISLHKNGKEKRFKIHRLVAIAFIPNPQHLPEVHHKDGNKKNNNVSNLEWVTSKQNKEHAWLNKLINSNHRKRPIKCNESGICFESVVQASQLLKCDRRGIFRVLSGEKEKVKGMSFSYISIKELEEYRKGINP